MTLNPDEMRKRFHELGSARQEIIKQSAPLRERYEAKLAAIEAAKTDARPLLSELQAIEKPLFDIEQERSMLARALGFRTGEAG